MQKSKRTIEVYKKHYTSILATAENITVHKNQASSTRHGRKFFFIKKKNHQNQATITVEHETKSTFIVL